jgi:hypothetical protein
MPGPFAAPRHVEDPSQCWFYHTMDLPGIGTVDGQWDLRGDVDAYLGHVDLRGKRVLDVGSASGFLTFEMEARGASVVSFDMGEGQEWNLVPFAWLDSKRGAISANLQSGLECMKNGYWLAHRLLGSNAQAHYGNVYDLPESLGRFDAVVVAQILVHVRDPIAALTTAARLSDDYLIVTEGALQTLRPIARFYPQPGRTDADKTWWCYSIGLYQQLLRILGFRVCSIRRGHYRCLVEGMASRTALTTFVARRTPEPAPPTKSGMRSRLVRLFDRFR